jgi:amidase
MSALVVPQNTPGPMHRTVTNAALLLDALAGFDAEDSYTATAAINRAPSGGSYTHDLEKNGPATIATARLGILREQCFVPDSDPKCKAVNIIVKASLIKHLAQGAKLIDVEIPNLSHYFTLGSLYGLRSRNDIDEFLKTKKEENGLVLISVAEIVATKQYSLTSRTLEALASGTAHPHGDLEYLQRSGTEMNFRSFWP